MRLAKRLFFWIVFCLAVGLMTGGVAELALRLYGITDPLIYRIDERFGYEPERDQEIHRRNLVQIVDDEGFRSTERVCDRACRRIVFLGDSVTNAGTYTRTEDTFIELVNRDIRARGWVAKNGGVNGYSVAQMANRYMYSLESDLDDIVVVYFINGDWYRPPLKMPLPGFPFYLKKPRCAAWEAIRVFSALRLGVDWGGGFRIPASVTGSEELRGRVGYARLPHFLDRNMEAAAALIDFCQERDRHLLFVHSPALNWDMKPLEPKIVEFLRGRGVDLVDFAEAYGGENPDRLLRDMCHYTPAGHRVAAELLRRILIPLIEGGSHGGPKGSPPVGASL